MVVEVLGTAVRLRLATDDETRAVVARRRGLEVDLRPQRSHVVTGPAERLGEHEAAIVCEAFVDFAEGDASQRWFACEHHGWTVPTDRDPTLAVLLAASAPLDDDLLDLMAAMRIGGLRVSRWQVMSAPRRIELDPALRDRLAPMRRG